MIRSLLLAATFDADWYLRAYSWVNDDLDAGRCASAIDHFRRMGAAAGCNPNPYFSEEWYRYTYPDAVQSLHRGEHASGFDHFVAIGRDEERRPNAMAVDDAFYLARYPEVAGLIRSQSYASALDHYVLAGARSGYSPHAAFDESWYLEHHQDVQALVASGRYLSGYHHFLEHGLELGLQPHPLYSEASYRALNPDVDLEIRLGRLWFGFLHLQAVGLKRPWKAESEQAAAAAELASPAAFTQFDPTWYWKAYGARFDASPILSRAESFAHYRNVGVQEGLDPNCLFSEEWYRAQYSDIKPHVARGSVESGFEHYVRSGYAERRVPTPMRVQANWYRGRYRDVVALDTESDVDKMSRELEHYMLLGARMGRIPTPAFDEAYYLRKNPDIAAKVREGVLLCGYQHFMEVGYKEGRRPHAGYDESFYLERNPDVRAAVRSGKKTSGFHHLVSDGLAEGRVWSTGDDTPVARSAALARADLRLAEFLEDGGELRFPRFRKPEVAVILVLRNRAELTFCCLESLQASRDVTLEVVVVDNASDDRTSDLLERLSGVSVIKNQKNEGFVRAANRAARRARGTFLLFLNNDAEVFPTAIRHAVQRYRNTEAAGAVGARVVGMDGSLQEAGCIVWSDGTTTGYGDGDDPRNGAFLNPRRVDYCSGVFLLTNRDLFLRLNGFDERYVPAYYEDVDYCFRLREAGLEVVYEPGSIVFHLGQGSLAASWHVYQFTERNRPRFNARHAEALKDARTRPFEGGPTALAACRDPYRGRVLFIDDLVPLQALGSGFPRSAAMLRVLLELGYFVSFFGTNQPPFDRAAALRELPEWGLELHDSKRSSLAELISPQHGAWDLVMVSRSHNMSWLVRSGIDLDKLGCPVIYDCEALFSERHDGAALYLEPEDLPESSSLIPADADEEIELASAASAVLAVSEADAVKLRAGADGVFVVSHTPSISVTSSPFEARQGFLFVGRLDEPWNPNVDALRWFLGRVFPRLRGLLGERLTMNVVGRLAPRTRMPRPAGVEFVGRVDDLTPLYEAARVFVAPSRFGAGIPLKVVEAAAAGVPVAASALLAQQLGWQAGTELMVAGDDDPDEFASVCAELYASSSLWYKVQTGALARVELDHGMDSFRGSIVEALRFVGLEGE